MTARSLMFQGTGSDVGKSLMVAGLCRLFARRGLVVVPFKAQNMSNNAAVADDAKTSNGKGEIGRAQWLQALAARVAPSVHMNPVLLKPQSDKTSQVVLRGKVVATMGAREYQSYRKSLLPQVLESYNLLAKDADLILVEGAGSPAEINLRENDIANMGFAHAVNITANCPVVLIGDIERGGVIASLVGTFAVLPEADRKMIRGFIVNKFRGDANLFEAGAAEIMKRTDWKNLGLVPHFAELAKLPQEDSLALSSVIRHQSSDDALHIAVLHTPHIANFDDLDPLANDPNLRLVWVRAGEVIPADVDIVVLAGSKSTIADLAFIKAQGWDIDLQAHRRRGGRIIGICGGYQMLGKTLADPHGVEGEAITVEGLGFLDVDTVFTREKTVRNVSATGYEIHVGETTGASTSEDGLVWGSYVHGLFANDEFRAVLFQAKSCYNYKQNIEQILNDWADILEEYINIEQLLELAK
ncbi:MAG: cobyric acid synthase [Rickettsiales bacterium]|jgi:adenosylcobyric acid synthase